MMTYKNEINNLNENINENIEQNQPKIEMIETKTEPNWREFLETQEFYLEAAGN